MNDVGKYAPVVIATLCRYEHFKRCIESLAQCTHAGKTDIYIALDYPLNESHWDGYEKILSYVDLIVGFQSVTVIKRELNFGAVNNIRSLISVVLRKYDRYILSEDDNEFSPNFLDYMNNGLEKYENEESVFAICGFTYPEVESFKEYSSNVYVAHGYNAWGTGFWKNKYEKASFLYLNNDYAMNLLHSWKIVFKLFRKRRHVMINRLIFRLIRGRGIGDVMWRIYLILENKYCIMPIISKVRNCGHDGSGTNCLINDLYTKQPIDTMHSFVYDDICILESREIKNIYNKLYGGSFMIRRTAEIQYLIFRIFNKNIATISFAKYLKKKYLNSKGKT